MAMKTKPDGGAKSITETSQRNNCVYIHVTPGNEVVYVGEGKKCRPFDAGPSHRLPDHAKWMLRQFRAGRAADMVRIAADGLTKAQAKRLERKLRAEHRPRFDRAGSNGLTGGKHTMSHPTGDDLCVVYKHVGVDGEVVYVGEGREYRPYYINGRSAEHQEWLCNELYVGGRDPVRIVRRRVTKARAKKLEKALTAKHCPRFNRLGRKGGDSPSAKPIECCHKDRPGEWIRFPSCVDVARGNYGRDDLKRGGNRGFTAEGAMHAARTGQLHAEHYWRYAGDKSWSPHPEAGKFAGGEVAFCHQDTPREWMYATSAARAADGEYGRRHGFGARGIYKSVVTNGQRAYCDHYFVRKGQEGEWTAPRLRFRGTGEHHSAWYRDEGFWAEHEVHTGGEPEWQDMSTLAFARKWRLDNSRVKNARKKSSHSKWHQKLQIDGWYLWDGKAEDKPRRITNLTGLCYGRDHWAYKGGFWGKHPKYNSGEPGFFDMTHAAFAEKFGLKVGNVQATLGGRPYREGGQNTVGGWKLWYGELSDEPDYKRHWRASHPDHTEGEWIYPDCLVKEFCDELGLDNGSASKVMNPDHPNRTIHGWRMEWVDRPR